MILYSTLKQLPSASLLLKIGLIIEVKPQNQSA